MMVCGVMYDLLKKAPLVSVTTQGINLFTRRGATILEGALYGVLVIVICNRFFSLLSVEEEFRKEQEDQNQNQEEQDTREDLIAFNISIILVCMMVMVILFNFKTPWYLRKMSSSLFSVFA